MKGNPLKKTLERLNIDPSTLSALAGVDTTQVYRALQGRSGRIPASLSRVLARMGEDVESLNTEYVLFRKEQAEAAIAGREGVE